MKEKNQERGVALLFAIGIVGLMMLLLVTYATVSMTSRDVANNSYAQYSARLLAENIANRVLLVLNSFEKDYYARLIDLRSKGETDSVGTEKNDGLKTELAKLKHSFISKSENDDMRQVIENSFSNSSYSPKWCFIKDTTGKITARFAYTTYRPLGLLDPLKLKGNADNTTTVKKTIKDKFDKNDVVYWTEKKETKDGLEVLKTESNTLLQQTEIPDDDEKARPYIWYDALFAKSDNFELALTAKEENDAKWNKYLNNYLKSPASPYTGEYFWYSKDGTAENAKRYYRFNLNRTDWNTMTVDQLLDTEKIKEYDRREEDYENYIPGKPASTRDTASIPWLACGKLPEQQRKQIAANLITFMATVMGQEDSIGSAEGNPNSAINENKSLRRFMKKHAQIPSLIRLFGKSKILSRMYSSSRNPYA